MFLIFYCEVENFFYFCLFQFFLYDLFTNKAKKLEVAESNPIMKIIPISPSLSVRVPFVLVHVLSLSLSHSIALSLSLYVDAALQLLLYGVMSSSLILINNEL